jgi:hypothetical protein
VFLVSIGGLGATAPEASWLSWLNGQLVIAVTISRVFGEYVELLGVSEFRQNNRSPVLGQSDALAGSGRFLSRHLSGGPSLQENLRGTILTDASTGNINYVFLSAQVAWRSIVRRLVGVIRPEGPDHWQIGVAARVGSDPQDGFPSLPPWESFHWLRSAQPGFVTDPFLIRLRCGLVLFYEELEYSSWRGVLKAVGIDELGRPSGTTKVVLTKPFHLSFPQVFCTAADPDGVYLIPEQAASGRVLLYRSADAPRLEELHFEEDCVLLPDFRGIDPVLLQHEGHWYLFVTDGAFGCGDNNLQLYIADELRGPYTLHAQSPIHEGLRGSRMAGPIFSRQGQFFRVGQDCRRRYGERIVLYRIEALSPLEYRETELGEIGPDVAPKNAAGLHSLSFTDSHLALDTLKADGAPSSSSKA